ncbi:MAG: DUF481 domain-containing protein [Myxococcales bacterium]|nr:DUF481 domain-containing protein [Myxococcales bacterium]
MLLGFRLLAGAALLAAAPLATAAEPPDAKALAPAAKAPDDAPVVGKAPDDGTVIAVSSGGMLTSGNSRVLAVTASGVFESRFGRNAAGASLLGNYGHGAAPGSPVAATAQNIQGRLRYDRYAIDRASVFLLLTGRHDRFQGLDFRFNVDPGLKVLFVKDTTSAFWGEAGYDLQHDVRRDDARVVLDGDKTPVLDGGGHPVRVDKTLTDHSSRLFVGYRRAFNREVTLTLGLEHLQSVIASTRWRMNFDALLAARIVGGLAFGFGFGARYDHAPLPGKADMDTTMTASLIFAFSDLPRAKDKTAPCPACPPLTLPPPPPPQFEPAAETTRAP